MQYVSVRSVASRLKSRFKVDMDIFDVVQACGEALKKMGVIALERSIYSATVSNFGINLPGSVWKVRGVIRLDVIPEPPITISVQDIFFPAQVVFTVPDPAPTNPAPILFKANYIPQFKGPYIDYKWDSPWLRFNETGIPVAIEVTGLKVDEEKFPMIPEESFFGCLFYSLFVYYEPLFLLKQIDGQMMEKIEKWKNDNISQSNTAAAMQGLTSNERNKLFDILTSFDRKAFGLPV